MGKRLVNVVVLVTFVALASPALADSFVCQPVEVSAYAGRVHVKCSLAADDGGAQIRFWAVSTGNADHANRFITLATTALVSGRSLILSYTAGDTSGVVFGCQANNCRVAWAIALL